MIIKMHNLTDTQKLLVETSLALGAQYGPDYWLKMDDEGTYPKEFIDAIGANGFFALGLPEEYGGIQSGLYEQALAMEALCRGGAGGGPALGYLFGALGANVIKSQGNENQKQGLLPRLASGEALCAFGLSEPDAGTNSFNIKTYAKRDGDDYIINGSKWYITNIEQSDVIVLVARTEKPDEVTSRADGISLFLIDLPNPGISYTPIDKHGFKYYKSNSVFIDNLRVPATALIGEHGKGFKQLLGTLNPERVLIASAAIGLGRLAIQKAIEYANERVVFNQPIGAHQAIQHPLAAAYAKLESAWDTVQRSALMHDEQMSDLQIGSVANIAKYVAAEACIDACYHAMQTHGGNGYAREYHIERWFREAQLFRLAPLTQQMTLNFIGEHVLNLPRSY